MKNLSRGKKIALIVGVVLAVSALATGGVFGAKKIKAKKAQPAQVPAKSGK